MIHAEILTMCKEFGIPQNAEFNFKTFTVDTNYLPKQRVDGKLMNFEGMPRCNFKYKQIANQGQYGLIQRVLRYSNYSIIPIQVAIKRPRNPALSLESEAFLQGIIYRCLERRGIHGAVPAVHDIFLFADEVRFSMDWIEGISCRDFFYAQIQKEPAQFEEIFLNSLIQLCFILTVLEEELSFDHRDLNLDNIWVRKLSHPKKYKFQNYTISFSHQLVLLDFGFACMGLNSKLPIGLGHGIIPEFDPCPKDGRDIYHILNDFINTSVFSKAVSATLLETMKSWMLPYRVHNAHLTHLITSDIHFNNMNLTPSAILKWFFN